MAALTKSLMDSPIRLHLSRNSSGSTVGIRDETVLETCLHLYIQYLSYETDLTLITLAGPKRFRPTLSLGRDLAQPEE
jgi:hypothetical protein